MEVTGIRRSRLEQILNAEDPEGLLALGAPPDEYRGEAEKIAAALRQWQRGTPGEPDIIAVLEAVWSDSFGPLSQEEMDKRSLAFRRIGQRILKDLASGQRGK